MSFNSIFSPLIHLVSYLSRWNSIRTRHPIVLPLCISHSTVRWKKKKDDKKCKRGRTNLLSELGLKFLDSTEAGKSLDKCIREHRDVRSGTKQLLSTFWEKEHFRACRYEKSLTTRKDNRTILHSVKSGERYAIIQVCYQVYTNVYIFFLQI